MRAPLATYRALVGEARPIAVLPRMLAHALALGLLSSVSITRAPLASHWLASTVSWLFVPVVQVIVLTALVTAMGRRPDTRRLLGLSLAGNGPQLVAALLAAAWSLVPVDGAGLRYGPIAAMIVGAIGWGAALEVAFFRAALGRSRRAAILLVIAEWALRIAIVLGWFAFMNNLAPQFLGRRA